MRRLFRFITAQVDIARSTIRIGVLKLLYPGLKIIGSTIASGCKIICVKGSVIVIENSFIERGTKIIADHGGEVYIRNSYIGDNCVIVARELIRIEQGTKIAEMVVIRDQDHQINDLSQFNTAPIFIGANVWIGAKVTILKGSDIGDGCVVGAHSIVKNKLDGDAVYVGAPARKIKVITRGDISHIGANNSKHI
ncbi:acyltransferase [Niabella pedocola]|uniref:Acyltransferase n=1 Tax=Niabella pedocola TaxID=1752077 RepID=A0ABS8PVU5_9BACT|nr:acyltransferase [Niabella pedocola]MCD2425190.1 acyltransferase [Niabella pedocola]